MEVPSALGLLRKTYRFLDSWSRVVPNSCNEFADVLLVGRLESWKTGPSRSSSYLQYYVAQRMAEHTAKTVMMVVHYDLSYTAICVNMLSTIIIAGPADVKI